MPVLRVHARSRRVWLVRGAHGTHTVFCLEGGAVCSCPAFQVHGRCSHVHVCRNGNLGGEARVTDVLEIDEWLGSERKVYPSSLGALNELFDGEPYTSTEIFAVYALPGVGKTLLMLQEAAYLEALGYRVLFIDTEGSLGGFARRWLPVLRARFKDVGSGRKGKIYAIVLKTMESIGEFFGWKLQVLAKGSKTEFYVLDRLKKAKVDEVLGRNRIDVVIMDSVTMPIRTQIPSSPQNLPAKSDAEGFIMGQLMMLQDRYGVAVITTHHASVNPTNPYDISAEIRGGLSIKHTAKHVVYIDRREKKGFESIRRFWLVRAPDKEPWSEVRYARITDAGYVDMKAEDEEMLTSAELKRLRGARGDG